ncbi:MAG: MG2 domain-containing protein [Chloroflexota bacterium]
MLPNEKLIHTPRSLAQCIGMFFVVFIILATSVTAIKLITTASAQDNAPDYYGYGITFGVGNAIQVVDPDGLNYIPLWISEGAPIDVTLYPISVERFFNDYRSSDSFYQDANADQIWDVTDLAVQSQWQIDITPENTSNHLVRVVLPDETPSGLYIIEANQDGDRQMAMMSVGRHVLMLKEGNQGQVVAWVSNLQQGVPVADATVTVYSDDKTMLTQGTTDENGVAKLDVGNQTPYMVTAVMTDSDGLQEITVAGMTREWRHYESYDYQFSSHWWGSSNTPDDYTIYLHTDRPMYRPGHTVFFNAIVRSNDADGYGVIEASTVMTATLRDSRNTAVGTTQITADHFGTVNGSFILGDGVPLGDYSLELLVDGQTQRQKLLVEEYRKPEYDVEVSTPANFVIAGDEIPITVNANYFFGQPVADANVMVTVYRQPIYRYWSWWLFNSYTPNTAIARTFSGTTDSNGQFTAAFRSTDNSSSGNVYRPYDGEIYRIDAVVTDAQELPIESSASVRAYVNEFALTLSTRRYGYKTDEPIAVTLGTANHDGTPLVGQQLDVKILKDYWREPHQQDIVKSEEVTTDVNGQAVLTFTDVAQGWYRIVATGVDGRGRTVESRRYLWVYDPNGGRDWWYTSNQPLTLLFDQEGYVPGDTAELLIQSRKQGLALVTIEQEQVIEEKLVRIAGPVTTVNIEIEEGYAPNAVVRVHLFESTTQRGANNSDVSEGYLWSEHIELAVSAENKRLTVDITADAPQYLPSGEAQVTITLTDHLGQPVTGRVALAVVDEALFALQEDLSNSLFGTFYAQRKNYGIRTYDSLKRAPYPVFGAPTGQLTPTGEPTGTRVPSNADESSEESQPRRNFQDTAYWNATIDVGDDGTAVVTIPLPDNLTTWRLTARAVSASEGTDMLVGEAKSNILVTKELIARPTLPRFAVLGDLFRTSMVAQNYTGDDLVGTGLMEAENLLLLNHPSQSLDLPDKGNDVGRWTSVASHIGTGLVTTTLDTPAGKDIVELPFSVKPFAVPNRWTTSGVAAPSATETFTMPLNAINQTSELTLRLSPSIALGLLDGLDSLIAYPYGCVEQTMSRVLPSAVAIQAYNELGIANPKADELPSIIDKGLQKLYGYQHDNGTWGWFYDDDGSIYLTSYVLFGLTMVEQAGFAVDSTVLEMGFNALDSLLDGRMTVGVTAASGERPNEAGNDNILAYAFYVKAVAGRGNVSAAQSLAQRSAELKSDSLAMLAMALHIDGDSTAAQTLIDHLLERADIVGGRASWPEPRERWSWWHWRTMASAEKNTAAAVSALSMLRPESEVLPMAVRWLMDHRRGAGWRDTQATAFAVLGLVDYLTVSGELSSNYTYQVHLNGNEITMGSVTPDTVTEPIEPIVIPGTAFNSGPNELTISRQNNSQTRALEAQNPLYYTAVLDQQLFYEGYTSVTSVDQGLSLSRSYRLMENPSGQPSGDGVYHVGDVVEVTLDLTAKGDAWYVLIEDPIPAGFEALNERLNPTSYTPGYASYYWHRWGYNRKDVRDDRVEFFITHLNAGQRELTYQMRATTPGVFSVPPGQVYPMYAEEMWARTNSTQVTVSPNALAERPLVLADMNYDCRVTKFDTQLTVDAWGTDDWRRDVVQDGKINLLDILDVYSQQGSDCNQLVTRQAVATDLQSAANFLLWLPDNTAEVGDEIHAYVLAGDVETLGGFEMTINYSDELDVVDVILSDYLNENRRQNLHTLGPKIDPLAGTATFGLVELVDDETGDEVESQVRSGRSRILARAANQRTRADITGITGLNNATVLMTIVFRAQMVGDSSISLDEFFSANTAGQLTGASVDTIFNVAVDGSQVFMPFVPK